MTTERVFLGLGSNVGDREQYLEKALALLKRTTGIIPVQASMIYETEPVGNKDQSLFLNMVAEYQTTLTPEELLAVVQKVENQLGRVRRERWGPRTIDVDILLYGTKKINEAQLVIPHARLRERSFVLVPLSEIAPLYCLPTGERVIDLLNQLPASSTKKILPYSTENATI